MRKLVWPVIAPLFVVLLLAFTAGTVSADASKTIYAKALTDHSCDNSSWHFIINQIASSDLAPGSINVSWANGSSQTVGRSAFTPGGVAHYTTSSNLNSTVTQASTQIYASWGGEFNLSSGPCPQPTATTTRTPIPTCTPTPSPTYTSTTVPPTVTSTSTTVPETPTPTATSSVGTPTATSTVPALTSTSTATAPIPSATATAPAATATSTVLPPTATPPAPTATSPAATATAVTTAVASATPGKPGSGIIFVGKWFLRPDGQQEPENGVSFETGTARVQTGETGPGRAEFYLVSDGNNRKLYKVRLNRPLGDPNYVRCFVQEEDQKPGRWIEFMPNEEVAVDLPVAGGSKSRFECVNIPPYTPVPTLTSVPSTPVPPATPLPAIVLPKTGNADLPMALILIVISFTIGILAFGLGSKKT